MKQSYRRISFLIILSLLLTGCTQKVSNSPVLPTEKNNPTPDTTPTAIPTEPIVEMSEETETPVSDTFIIEQSYTEIEPLKDAETIQQILDQLQQYQLDFFSNVGWLHYTLINSDVSDFTRNEHFWVYIVDSNLGCSEQFVYFEYDGEILPYTIRLQNGSTTRIDPISGTLNPEFVFETAPICTLKSNWIITFRSEEDDTEFILQDESSRFQTFLDQNEPGLEKHYKAWIEDIEGKKVFVLEYEYNYIDSSTTGMIYDPLTGALNLPAQNLQWVYINIENGLPIQKKGVFYDQNGQIMNIWRSGTNNGIQYNYEFHETMPAPVLQAYEQSVNALKEYLQINQQ